MVSAVMATYASPSDIAVEIRGSTTVSPIEDTQWQGWLDRVERSIRAGFRSRGLDLAQAIADGLLTVADVKDVEISAVARKQQNPTGQTSETISVDDASITKRYESGAGAYTDPLALTSAEWARLLPSNSASAFSVRPGFEPDGEQ